MSTGKLPSIDVYGMAAKVSALQNCFRVFRVLEAQQVNLNSHGFHIVGDGQQPNSVGVYIPIIRIPY